MATPRPWAVIPPGGPQGDVPGIWNPEKGYVVADRIWGNSRDDADLIVRAVNAYDALIEACEAALLEILAFGDTDNDSYVDGLRQQLDAALALAKGEAS